MCKTRVILWMPSAALTGAAGNEGARQVETPGRPLGRWRAPRPILGIGIVSCLAGMSACNSGSSSSSAGTQGQPVPSSAPSSTMAASEPSSADAAIELLIRQISEPSTEVSPFRPRLRPSDAAVRLIKLRYEATRSICALLDRTRNVDEQAADLFYVLGFVHDPTTIIWLESKLREPQRPLIQNYWLKGWCDSLIRPIGSAWLDEPDRWSELMISIFDSKHNINGRELILTAPSGGADPKVVAIYVRAIESSETPFDEIVTLAERLGEDGVSVAEMRRVTAAIAAVLESPGSARAVDWSPTIPCQDAVKRLVAALDEDPTNEGVQRALVRLTFAFDTQGPAQWRRWYAEEGARSRAEWGLRAFRSIDGLVDADPRRAAQLLASQWWWNIETPMCAYLERWATVAEVRPAIIGFLTGPPALRRPIRVCLQRVADAILQSSGELPNGTLKAFRWYGYIGPEKTWQDFVDEVVATLRRGGVI